MKRACNDIIPLLNEYASLEFSTLCDELGLDDTHIDNKELSDFINKRCNNVAIHLSHYKIYAKSLDNGDFKCEISMSIPGKYATIIAGAAILEFLSWSEASSNTNEATLRDSYFEELEKFRQTQKKNEQQKQ